MDHVPAIFEAGARYRVRQGFASGPNSIFVAGEILTFERLTCSRYDNCSVYLFRSGSGDVKEWWLGEQDRAETWTLYFEPVGPSTAPEGERSSGM